MEWRKEIKEGKKEEKEGKGRKVGKTLHHKLNLQILLALAGWHMNNICIKYSALPLTESTGETRFITLGLYLLALCYWASHLTVCHSFFSSLLMRICIGLAKKFICIFWNTLQKKLKLYGQLDMYWGSYCLHCNAV